ncbi:glycoside hydrolase family 30 protein [Moniliophthora roreri MCA 2997]|uniref:Glycoside hydrolase family 30 protein n=1 Tax=Moniliophthora roreri (strain MCA 2997) TaxID=1381753 RepID=V2WXQ0_MONRO|nr:glycoside hydrolase family 30 protein [Moniliophthora roreri MCA 2997]
MWPLISTILALSACCRLCAGQQINDIWQTTWDRSSLFTSLSPSSPINFGPSGSSSNLSIQVDDTSIAQEIVGFGGSLTDSSALVLNNLKSRNPDSYQNLLRYMFDETDGANAAGLTYVRVPIGACDFSESVYSLDDVSGDTSFSQFDINRAPSYLFSVLKDILSVNPRIKVHIVPWSPPGWMKDTGTMTGGTLRSDMVQYYSTYLLKAAQAYQEMGIPLYAISIQNEPMNDNPTYPTCTMTPSMEGQIGMSLRDQLNSNGLENVKIIGFDHNWVYAGDYPISLLDWKPRALFGIWPNVEHRSRRKRALVNVEDDGSYSFNQEFTSMAHVAKATIPKDVGGPFARRIGVGLSGSLGWAVRVGAFVTERSSSSELPRYSLVVLNWYDNASSEWNPVPIEATIDFRGVQATYTFPVGITTMSWYA